MAASRGETDYRRRPSGASAFPILKFPVLTVRCHDKFLREESQTIMPLGAELDAIDWKILKELQGDGRMTNVELSSRVGISAPPCLRRVRRLEEAGTIRGYRAMLNAPALGFNVVAFCLVGLHHHAETELKAFSEQARAWPIVREAWMVSGIGLHVALRDPGFGHISVICDRNADRRPKCEHGPNRPDNPQGQG